MRTKKYVQTASYGEWEGGSDMDCARCGKSISEPRLWIHIVNGGDAMLHRDDEAQYVDDGGDLGMYVVGPECAKAIGSNFITEEV